MVLTAVVQLACPAGEGILPGATFTVPQFADWFREHFARGVYDGVALLGSHALVDDQGCVKSAETKGECSSIWTVAFSTCMAAALCCADQNQVCR